MGTFDEIMEAFMGYGYEIDLEAICKHLPQLVEEWSSDSASQPATVPSLVAMCVESLLLHPPLAAEALEDPRVESFHEVLATGDHGLIIQREEQSNGAGGKRVKMPDTFEKGTSEKAQEEENGSVHPYDRPEYELLHFQSKKIQDAMEKALSQLWPTYPSCGITVELVCHTGSNFYSNDLLRRNEQREATSRMFLLLQDKGPRYEYCDVLSENVVMPFDPRVSAIERWVVTKALHLLDLPIVTTVSTTVRTTAKTRSPTTRTVTTRSDGPRHQQQPSWMFGSIVYTIYG